MTGYVRLIGGYMPEDKKEKEVATNPKDSVGAMKPNLALIPISAMIYEAEALMYGNVKYDVKFNWRDPNKKVGAMTYLAALLRHTMDYIDGKEYTDDGLVYNLGAVRACAGILIDAKENGTLIDDRPPKGNGSELLEREANRIKEEMLPRWLEEKEKLNKSKQVK